MQIIKYSPIQNVQLFIYQVRNTAPLETIAGTIRDNIRMLQPPGHPAHQISDEEIVSLGLAGLTYHCGRLRQCAITSPGSSAMNNTNIF